MKSIFWIILVYPNFILKHKSLSLLPILFPIHQMVGTCLIMQGSDLPDFKGALGDLPEFPHRDLGNLLQESNAAFGFTLTEEDVDPTHPGWVYIASRGNGSPRCWFQISCIFTSTWGIPNLTSIFFRWVETTNQDTYPTKPPESLKIIFPTSNHRG